MDFSTQDVITAKTGEQSQNALGALLTESLDYRENADGYNPQGPLVAKLFDHWQAKVATPGVEDDPGVWVADEIRKFHEVVKVGRSKMALNYSVPENTHISDVGGRKFKDAFIMLHGYGKTPRDIRTEYKRARRDGRSRKDLIGTIKTTEKESISVKAAKVA